MTFAISIKIKMTKFEVIAKSRETPLNTYEELWLAFQLKMLVSLCEVLGIRG
jgi:hypothetical protein